MIVTAEMRDIQRLASLALKLWPDSSRQELENDFKSYISSSNDAVFIAKEMGEAIGFAHCSLRVDYVAGAEHSPAGYLEGIYVDVDHRQIGIAGTLLKHVNSGPGTKDFRTSPVTVCLIIIRVSRCIGILDSAKWNELFHSINVYDQL